MMRKTILFLSMAILSTNTLYAGGVGTTRVNFLKIPVNARVTGMSGAYGSIVGDINAIGHNPGGLSLLKKREIAFTHVQYVESIKYNWLTYAIPIKPGISRIDNELYTVKIEDFNSAATPNQIGGDIGTFNDESEMGASTINADYYSMFDEKVSWDPSGNCYAIEYHIKSLPEGGMGYAGLWIGLNNINARRYHVLSFMIKGDRGREEIYVGLKDINAAEVKLNLSDYKTVGRGWTMISIPVEDFSGVDIANLSSLSFSFRGRGKIYVDEIKFIGKRKSKQTIAVSVAQLNSGTMDGYTETLIPPFYEKSDGFSATETLFAFTYSRRITISDLNFPTGITVKMIREKLHPDTNASWAVATDIGFIYDLTYSRGKTYLGICAQNIGFMTAIEKDKDKLPFNIKTSAAFYMDRWPIVFDIDIDSPVDNIPKLSIGAQYTIYDMFFARTGYTFGRDIGEAAGGIGASVNNFQFDYAFVPFALFGNTHRITLSYKFK